MLRRRTIVTLLLIMSTGQVSFGQPAVPSNVTMYWTDNVTNKIQRVMVGFGPVEDVVATGLITPVDVALDLAGGKLYWADSQSATVGRANLDGSFVEIVASSFDRTAHPMAVAVDPAGGKVYWTEWCDSGCSTGDTIRRANLDGSDEEILIQESVNSTLFTGIDLDIGNGKMYWYNHRNGINRANTDGTDAEIVVEMDPMSDPLVHHIALDVAEGRIYWGESTGTSQIKRANICTPSPCADPDVQAIGPITNGGIGLDLFARKVYWTTHVGTGGIFKADLDGNNVELVQEMSPLFEPIGLAVDAQPAQVAPAPPIRAPAPHDVRKNRYISIDPRSEWQANPDSHHIKVTLDSTLVSGVDVGQVGSVWWANDPDAKCISMLGPTQPASEPDWSACPTLHLTGCAIMPTSTYSIATVIGAGDESAPLVTETQLRPDANKWWGDAVGTFTGSEWTGPQGVTSFEDVTAALKTFQDPNAFNATHVSVTDIHPNRPDLGGHSVHPNKLVSIDDIFYFIVAFQGNEYPGGDLAGCTDPD